MSSEHEFDAGSSVGEDRPAGANAAAQERTLGQEVGGYVVGLALAVGLTAASFWVRSTDLVYGPGLALALLVLAVAQMGIHLIFFLHITTDPDNANNVLALAFGVLIVCLIVFGSLWVMEHLNHNMVPMQELMRMQR
jgi:cytochrome o ubiquinol oxidase operon protein cyoD